MFLPVEEQVRRVDRLSEAGRAEATGGGKPAAEAYRGRTGGGHPGFEGGGRKKVVSPEMRREAVLVMQVEVELSQRRACGLMDLYRATCRYRETEKLKTNGCECVCASWPRPGGGSAIAVCRFCWSNEGWQVTHKRLYRLYVAENFFCHCGASVGESAARPRQPHLQP